MDCLKTLVMVQIMDQKKHIILIDDEPVIHLSLEMMLFESSYKITSIYDPEEAIRYIKSIDKYDKPDLFIVDLMMGKVSGIDVINSIRGDVYYDNIPVILYTGHLEVIINENEMLKKLNIACVLPKVVDKEHLLEVIIPLLNTLG
jgi:DNA-binding response OmpR family regulator